MSRKPLWQPRFTITAAMARGLMAIEGARAAVERTPLPPAVESELRRRARVRSTHFSTRIEGNRLTLAEAERVIGDRRARFQGRERDILEVRNYWTALLRVEEWAVAGVALDEERVRRLHGMVERGARARPTPYRDGQNVIRDAASGAIVYLPPEAKDVPALMAEWVRWVEQTPREGLPIPLIAGLAHYQFVTIHPFYDGNGRTARLLATFLLHRGGYGLCGFYSLEEEHGRDLTGYYRALSVHPHHNYYEGRAEADLTSWLEYFIQALAAVFDTAREEAQRHAAGGAPHPPAELSRLDARARRVLGLCARLGRVTSRQVAEELALSPRMARNLLRQWVEDGWLEMADASRRGRAYRLSARYRQSIGNSSAMPEV